MAVKLWACEAVCLNGTHDMAVVDRSVDLMLYAAECKRFGIRLRETETRVPLKPGEYVVWEM